MIRLAALLGLLAAPASGQSAVDWLAQNTETPLNIKGIDQITLAPGGLIVTDALIADSFDAYTRLDTPAGPARFVVAFDPAIDARVSKAMLVFSDAAVVCGHDAASVGIDTGLAAFFDRPRLDALLKDAEALGPGKDIYTDWFQAIIGQINVVAQMVPLPSGASIPMTSTGYGDGGYPVATLSDASGQIVAVYVDFMGRDDAGTWLLPPECPGT